MKRCSKCGVVKPLGEFYKEPRWPAGTRPECILCSKEVAKLRRKANPEKEAARRIAYEKSEKGRATRDAYKPRKKLLSRKPRDPLKAKEYYEKNKVLINEKRKENVVKTRERARKYREENRERLLQEARARYAKNPTPTLLRHIKRWGHKLSEYRKYTGERLKKNREILGDAYVRRSLKEKSKVSEVTPHLMNLKREQLTIYRIARQLKKAANETSKDTN